MSIFGKWGYKRLGGKKGLTLIELLIVLVILAILAGVIVLAVGGIFGRTGEQAYNLVRDEVQLAVTAWSTNTSHSGQPTMTNASNVDVCLLILPPELLRDVPDGVGTANGNCTTLVVGTDLHYTWTVDANGNVGSVCTDVGTDTCIAAGDGYQGQWP